MDAHENSLVGSDDIPEGKTPLEALKDAFALGNAASPHMAGTRVLRWAAIHFGETSRNARGGNFEAAWREVLWPLVGAYQVLTEDGVPVGIVTDDQLEHGELDGYRLLVLPNPGELSHGQQHAVARFKDDGGIVVENDPAWRWSDPGANEAAAAAFRAALRAPMRDVPLRVIGGPPGRYAVAYQHPERLVVAVTNDFSWVQIQWEADDINQSPPPAAGVRVGWRKDGGLLEGPSDFGRPRAVEAITGTRLRVEESARAFRVILPRFKFMALLVVTREQTPPRRRSPRTTA
jgi:hypothetical protein